MGVEIKQAFMEKRQKYVKGKKYLDLTSLPLSLRQTHWFIIFQFVSVELLPLREVSSA